MFNYKLDQLFFYILYIIYKNIVGLKVSFDRGKIILGKRLENVGVKYTRLIVLYLGLLFLEKP